MDSAALSLHGFYNGIERLFEIIAITIDGVRPQGTEWHQDLLTQMAIEIPEIRPAVISESSREALDHYRRFRHVVRHIYAFEFVETNLQKLVEEASDTLTQVSAELTAFAAFLESQS